MQTVHVCSNINTHKGLMDVTSHYFKFLAFFVIFEHFYYKALVQMQLNIICYVSDILHRLLQYMLF